MVLGGLYYLIAEFITAIFFRDSLANTYIFHTISELGIPNMNSPLAFLMNSAFIIIGLALLFGYFVRFKDFIIKNKIIITILKNTILKYTSSTFFCKKVIPYLIFFILTVLNSKKL